MDRGLPSPFPPDDARPAVLRQVWRDVAFLHWPLDPAVAAPLLPPGTRPDVLAGTTYVGVVSLRIARTAPATGPALPWVGAFDEVNVRLYAVDEQGRRGVVFRRMHAARLPAVLAARALPRLPYVWSRTRVRRDGDRYAVTVGRDAQWGLRIGPPVTPGPLEVFVTAWWGLHTRVAGRTVYVPVVHPPWALRRAELTGLTGDPLAATGVPAPPGSPVSVLFSPGTDDVRIGAPRGG
ncbi:YqjF family protein [Geodermatophilus sp. URMC 61]|uniref:YqjF family protein n=1 Tax=Geodermatophilus sp. URMC 61 TaxID=3423411 RepID=UPI00406C1AD7